VVSLTQREVIGIVILGMGFLARALGPTPDRTFRVIGAVCWGLGLLLILSERARRGLGPPTLSNLKKELLNDPPNAAETDWVCPRCHERNPVNFEVCWKCTHSKPDGAASNNRRRGP
jgi:hypothetical protein